MATWVALLRAVNLGRRNKVPMAELRRVLAEAGYGDVRTLIASGNVVFESARPRAAHVEELIHEAFAVRTTAILRSAAQIRRLASSKPFDGEGYVAFAAGRPQDPLGGVLVGADVVFPRDLDLTGAAIERRLGMEVTVRNWRTVEKLAALVG